MNYEAVVWRRKKVKIPSNNIRSPNVVSIRFVEKVFYLTVRRAFKVTP